MKLFSFGRSERLTHKNLIEQLFQEGIAFNMNPVRVLFRFDQNLSSPGIKILVTVPRRKFKKAVIRNRLKRQLREAYRLNKHILNEISLSTALNIGFIYVGDKADIPFETIQLSMQNALLHIKNHLYSHSS